MGYSTDFDGSISIEPPLNPEQIKQLNEFCEQDHREGQGKPGYYCDLQFADDGTRFGWNGSEKTYELPAWVQYIVNTYLKPWGCTTNGELRASGEESGDLWTLAVDDNVVTARRAIISW